VATGHYHRRVWWGAAVRRLTRRQVVGGGLRLAVLLAVGAVVLVRVTADGPDKVVR
jgi:hypothetical protein